jgi:hypothetical protein
MSAGHAMIRRSHLQMLRPALATRSHIMAFQPRCRNNRALRIGLMNPGKDRERRRNEIGADC